LTTTGAADRCNSGRNALVTRTVPKTLVSNVFRITSIVSSAGPITPLSAPRSSIAALLTKTSRPPLRLALLAVVGTQTLVGN